MVYPWCMSRTNIDIDDDACAIVMARYRLRTKREAANLALDTLAAEPLDPVRMEVLAGARDEQHLADLRRLLARAGVVTTTPADYETAASLYRTCRRQGETVRRLIDCLIAAAAIVEAAVAVAHRRCTCCGRCQVHLSLSSS